MDRLNVVLTVMDRNGPQWTARENFFPQNEIYLLGSDEFPSLSIRVGRFLVEGDEDLGVHYVRHSIVIHIFYRNKHRQCRTNFRSHYTLNFSVKTTKKFIAFLHESDQIKNLIFFLSFMTSSALLRPPPHALYKTPYRVYLYSTTL